MTDITIYHNPNCGTSRNTLAMIRNSSVEPRVVLYLETPPSREELVDLIAAMNIPARDILRRKGTPYDELDLDNPKWTDADLIDIMPPTAQRRAPSGSGCWCLPRAQNTGVRTSRDLCLRPSAARTRGSWPRS
ncbi:arsenate reductase family protein [Burkholderia ubonensis]|uniref:arsenate reductase family protein n=1 Tax=Burkholderia ubonensis TaxID=101571 RepID=UPI000A5275BE|nr:arsenate reductase family protein [Burkholderia ubonensis]